MNVYVTYDIKNENKGKSNIRDLLVEEHKAKPVAESTYVLTECSNIDALSCELFEASNSLDTVAIIYIDETGTLTHKHVRESSEPSLRVVARFDAHKKEPTSAREK